MPDAAYYRAWRAAHPGYAKRQTEIKRKRRASHGREDRTKEFANRKSKAGSSEPIPQLYEEVRNGRGVSFLQDEMRMDMEQEKALALIEGRDPAEAARAYRMKEAAWIFRSAAPFYEDRIGDSDDTD